MMVTLLITDLYVFFLTTVVFTVRGKIESVNSVRIDIAT